MSMFSFSLVDTHTGGEPTRVLFADEFLEREGPIDSSLEGIGTDPAREIVAGMRGGKLRDAVSIRAFLRDHVDEIRRGVVGEPRGSESMVGAWVFPSVNRELAGSLVFFNNVGYLGMCGHGLIGVVEAMRYSGRISPGRHRFDTPAGEVAVMLHDDLSVTFENVPSYRYRQGVTVCPAGADPNQADQHVIGDIAFGGNWFFLVDVPAIEFSDLEGLLVRSRAIRDGLRAASITGHDCQEIDHIELGVGIALGGSDQKGGRNFVLCPGGHYDRSPCGTGTSAKVACLAADGKLSVGQSWVQESVIGSRFSATYLTCPPERLGESDASNPLGSVLEFPAVIVSVRGRAFVTAETRCILDSEDPFRHGIVVDRQDPRVV